MSANEDAKNNEDEPLAEADAVECEAPADLCEFGATDREGTATESEASLREELLETFSPDTTPLVLSPDDGMPIPANERGDLALAHPFTRETVVCLEDDTEYVELFSDEAKDRGWVEKRSWLRRIWCAAETIGKQCTAEIAERYGADGIERKRKTFPRSAVKVLYGVAVAVVHTDGRLFAVRPKRERCKFFMRQIMANDDVPNPGEVGHFIRFYNCTMRRSVGGAFMTLRDEAVYACDYRDPPDRATAEKYLDAFDRKRLDEKLHLKMIRPFNLG